MYTKEQRRLLRMLSGIVKWKKGKKRAQLQKKRLLRKIEYWEKTRKAPTTKKAMALAQKSPESVLQPSSALVMGQDSSLEPAPSVKAQVESLEALHREQLSCLGPGLDLFRFPIIDWHYRWQRPQQLCRQFAQNGMRVFYFCIETTAVNDRSASFQDITKKIKIDNVEPNVWLIKLCSYSKLNAYQDSLKHPLDKKFMKWSLEALKQKFGIRHTVSIVDLPFWSTLVFELKQNKIIYDCMDEHAGFSNTSSELLALEPNLLSKSDAVVTSSEYLYKKARLLNSSAYLIQNAGEFEHFSVNPKEPPAELLDIKGPVIGYIGAIADWFDMKLVYELAVRNRDWNFVLIGNTYYSDTSKVEQLANVYLLGEKPYTELPKYLHLFHVCLIPFVINPLTLATNPVKVYEYLAAGKPVVSTELPELLSMREYVRLAQGTSQFESAIRQALREKDPVLMEKRRLFAAENTWTKRYQAFEALISERLYPKVSITIVTHNNWEMTQRCIQSLLSNCDYPRIEIIIVDNGSSDETPTELMKLQKSGMKVILLPENTGFAAANTIGITNATGEYMVLLNNDTIVPKGWIPKMLRPFLIDPEIGAVGPMSNHVGNDQKLDFFVGDSKRGANEQWLEEFYGLYEERFRYTDLLGFFCVAIKKDVFSRIGHLDKNYGIGMFEDDDYCLRMLDAGFRLAIAEDAFIYHHGSATFRQWEEDKYSALFKENRAYFEAKWRRQWKQPKMPLSLFVNVIDSSKVAELVSDSGKRPVLVNCPTDWGHPKAEWQLRLLEHCNDQTIVIACIGSYLDEPVYGIRKIGPGLYFTSSKQLVEKIKFTHVYTYTDKRAEVL